MAENILEQLEWLRGEFYDVDSVTSIIDLAANEIERLRTALALAVGELSTHDAYRVWSPDQLLEQFMEEARRG